MTDRSCVILRCPNCARRLRVPTDRGGLLVTCPECRHRWEWAPAPCPPPEIIDSTDLTGSKPRAIATMGSGPQFGTSQTSEQRQLFFRCAQTGRRFAVLFGRPNPSQRFRTLTVGDDSTVPDQDDSSKNTEPHPDAIAPCCGPRRRKTGHSAMVSSELQSFDAADFDFAGWYCPFCGHYRATPAKTPFVRCSSCGECVCGGRIIEVPGGPVTFACHDGCQGSGRVEGCITSFDGTTLEPKGGQATSFENVLTLGNSPRSDLPSRVERSMTHRERTEGTHNG